MRRKYTIDLDEHTTRFASPDVKVFKCPSTNLSVFADASLDISFMSNFFEHLKSRLENNGQASVYLWNEERIEQ
jgi:predicted SAM-dependent methyltransferase